MVKRNKYRARLLGIVLALVCLVCGYCVLVTVQEKYGYDFGLSVPQLPFVDELLEGLGGLVPAAGEDGPLPAAAGTARSDLRVHFLDVGQGESILIQAPGKTVLIDAGENDRGAQVVRDLRAAGVEYLDIVIGTHPHSDHIGGLDTVIRELPVGAVILPVLPDSIVPATITYTDLLEAIDAAGLSITPAQPGDEYDLGGGAVLAILGPAEEYEDLNNMSVAARVDFRDTSFLFTGDAEARAEDDLVRLGGLDADVLSVGHHGSATSSIQEFLDAISPRIAVISCGLDNGYGHPHREVIERLRAMDTHILRTDLDGAVLLVSDGESIAIQTGT